MVRIRQCRLVVGSRDSRRPSIGVMMMAMMMMNCVVVLLGRRRALWVMFVTRGAVRATDG